MDAWINLGTLLVAQGDLSRAEISFRQAVRAEEGNIEANLMLALSLVFQDRGDEAAARAEIIGRSAPSEERRLALERLAHAFSAAGREEYAQKMRELR